MPTTIADLAREFAAAFTEGRRDDANGNKIRTLKDGAPSWMSELVQTAHGDMLPDDWRYSWIEDVALAIEDAADSDGDVDLDDVREQFVGDVDVYNGRLLAWVSSNINRAFCVDEAVSELGWPESGFFGALMMGQSQERGEVFDAVRAGLEEHLAETDEA